MPIQYRGRRWMPRRRRAGQIHSYTDIEQMCLRLAEHVRNDMLNKEELMGSLNEIAMVARSAAVRVGEP